MRISTIALIIGQKSGEAFLAEILTDESEIEILKSAIGSGTQDPLQSVHEFRALQVKQENDFADYLEELLSKPFLNPDIQKHGLQWLKSKIKIEGFQQRENDAAEVIAAFGYEIYQKDTTKTDFLLASPNSQVRIQVFRFPGVQIPQKNSA